MSSGEVDEAKYWNVIELSEEDCGYFQDAIFQIDAGIENTLSPCNWIGDRALSLCEVHSNCKRSQVEMMLRRKAENERKDLCEIQRKFVVRMRCPWVFQ